MKFSALGFTLVELLVVIAIMAIVGVFTLANYRSFGEDQNLKNAVLDIQSLLRQTQTNATTNVICQSQYSATWQIVFLNATTINSTCTEPSASVILKKTLQLGPNIQIQTVAGSSSCPAVFPFTVNFSLLSGKMDFGVANCTLLTITLRNSQTNSTKDLTLEAGGRIYGQ